MTVKIRSVIGQEAVAKGMTSAAVAMGAGQGAVEAAATVLAPPSWDNAGLKAWASTQANLHMFSDAVRRGLFETARSAEFMASTARGYQSIDRGARIGLGL